MFKNLFKPKWKSSKPQVRKLAVQQLDLKSDDGRSALLLLAKDDVDQGVRIAAISRVDELAVLTSMLEKNESEGLKESICVRIGEVISRSADNAVKEKIEVLSNLGDPIIFNYIIKNSTQVEVQLAAIDKVEGQENLEDLAINAKVSKLRQKAIELLVDIDALQRVASKSKGKDKSVYRIAKEKLDAIRDEITKRKEDAAECERLCLAIEKHSCTSLEPLYEQKWSLLSKQWEALTSEHKASYEARISEARALCEKAISEYTSEAAQRKLDGELHNDALGEQQETCKVLEDAFDLVKSNAEMQGGDLPAIEGLLTTQKIRWEEAASVLSAPDNIKGRYDSALKNLTAYLSSARQLFESGDAIVQLIKDIEMLSDDNINVVGKAKRSVNDLLKKINWPLMVSTPSAVNDLKAALGQVDVIEKKVRDNQKRIVDSVKKAIVKLQSDLQDGALKPANKRIREIQNLLKKIPSREADYYQKELKSFSGRFNELRDWQGYATTPKKELLCDQMEALIDVEMDPQDKADKIKLMQHDWKELGQSDPGKEKALWERFKIAGDEAYEPCREYFSDLSSVREANNQKRIALCDQLDAYVENNNWDDADWKVVLEMLQLAKSEWRGYSPVERKTSRGPQERFNTLLHTIQSKLDEERARNVKKRESIIAEALALVDVDDMQAAVNAAKNLQQKWRTIGMVQRKDDQRLWKEFRQACDAVFERRQQKWESLNEQRVHNQAAVEALCEQLEQVLVLGGAELIEQKNLPAKLKEELEKNQPLPKETADKLKKRFLDLSKQIGKKVAQAGDSLLTLKYDSLWKQTAIAAAMEDVVLKQQLDDRKLAEFREQWNEAGALPDDLVVSMNARFDNAVDTYTSGDVEGFAVSLERHNEQCHELAIRMEILVGDESPAEDKAFRMELQINRLNQGMGGSENLNELLQRKQLEADWCCNGPVNQDVIEPWLQRFKAAAEKIS